MEQSVRVCCAILMKGNLVLCAQRNANKSQPLKWEFPGGKIENGEKETRALKREILEELGVEIEVFQRFEPNFHRYPEGKTIELIPYLCQIRSGEIDVREHEAIRWVTVDRFGELDWAEADIPILRSFTDWYKKHL